MKKKGPFVIRSKDKVENVTLNRKTERKRVQVGKKSKPTGKIFSQQPSKKKATSSQKPKRRYISPKPKDWALDWASEARTEAKLVFSPTAWAKIQFFRDNENEVEVCGFGISNEQNLLVVEDFQLVKQKSEMAFTDMDDEDLADFIEDSIDEGIGPDRCSRIWIHTHPGMSPRPSGHDRNTFAETFKTQEWSIMCIVSNGESAFAELKITKPLKLKMEIPVSVDYTIPVKPIDYEALAELYTEKVQPYSFATTRVQTGFEDLSYLDNTYQSAYQRFWNRDLQDKTFYGNEDFLTSDLYKPSSVPSCIDIDDESEEKGSRGSLEDVEQCAFCGDVCCKSDMNPLGVCERCEDYLEEYAETLHEAKIIEETNE